VESPSLARNRRRRRRNFLSGPTLFSTKKSHFRQRTRPRAISVNGGAPPSSTHFVYRSRRNLPPLSLALLKKWPPRSVRRRKGLDTPHPLPLYERTCVSEGARDDDDDVGVPSTTFPRKEGKGGGERIYSSNFPGFMRVSACRDATHASPHAFLFFAPANEGELRLEPSAALELVSEGSRRTQPGFPPCFCPSLTLRGAFSRTRSRDTTRTMAKCERA